MRFNCWFYSFFTVCALLTSTSCQQTSSPSVLVIAVDSLPVGEIQCNEELLSKPKSGLAEICKNSVRFTHFFTSSALSLPAITSLLTGQYPFQSGVHSNSDFLRPESTTLAEVAIGKKYHTSFFSGGPSVLRKSNLHQGFEVFDDHWAPTSRRIHRSFGRSAELFLAWLKQDVGSNPFFSVIYAADLSFQFIPKVPEAGEIKPIVTASPVDEVDDTLYTLVQYLKEKRLWNSSYVVLVGLNGQGFNDRKEETASTNLHTENIQTALLIKPPFRARDEGVSWKIDSNFSMADLGYTLRRIFDPQLNEVSKLSVGTPFPVLAFNDQILTNTASVEHEAPIPIETSFRDQLRYAIVDEHMLYLEKEHWTVYNTLTDRLEVNPISLSDSDRAKEVRSAIAYLSRQRSLAWTPMDSTSLKLYSLPQSNWLKPSEEGVLRKNLEKLFREDPHNEKLREWLIALAFEKKNWNDLLKLSKNSSRWILVNEIAAMNLKNQMQSPTQICSKLLRKPQISAEDLQECQDPQLQLVLSIYFSESLGLNREPLIKRLERSIQNSKIDAWVVKNNIAFSEIWKLNPSAQWTAHPAEVFLQHPLLNRMHIDSSR